MTRYAPLFALALALASGCNKHTFVFGNAGMVGEPDYKKWHSAVLWGLIELDVTDAGDVCGDKKVQAVQDVHNVWNTLVTGITYGIYTASTVKVWCGGKEAELELPAQDGAAAVDVGAALALEAQDAQAALLTP